MLNFGIPPTDEKRKSQKTQMGSMQPVGLSGAIKNAANAAFFAQFSYIKNA